MPPRLTLHTYLVLRALGAEGETYGAVLRDLTGLPSGTLYPILARLDDAGWIVSRREDADPSTEGRPVRRYVQLTDTGRDRLEELREKYSHIVG